MAEFYYTCLDCIFKHLRDAEHHIEDAMTEAEKEKNNKKLLFFSKLKEDIRQCRKRLNVSFDVDLGSCSTCDARTAFKPLKSLNKRLAVVKRRKFPTAQKL